MFVYYINSERLQLWASRKVSESILRECARHMIMFMRENWGNKIVQHIYNLPFMELRLLIRCCFLVCDFLFYLCARHHTSVSFGQPVIWYQFVYNEMALNWRTRPLVAARCSVNWFISTTTWCGWLYEGSLLSTRMHTCKHTQSSVNVRERAICEYCRSYSDWETSE